MKTMRSLAIGLCCLLLTAGAAFAKLTPVDLRCDYAVNPLGVDSQPPRLFWKLKSSANGQSQFAYEILVASSAKKLNDDHGDLWDSGKIISDDTIQINYAGQKLSSSQQVFWKVRVGCGRQNFRLEQARNVDDGRS